MVTEWERWAMVGLTTLPLWTGIAFQLRALYRARRGYGGRYAPPKTQLFDRPPWVMCFVFCFIVALRVAPALILGRNLTLGVGSIIVLVTWLAGGFIVWLCYFAQENKWIRRKQR